MTDSQNPAPAGRGSLKWIVLVLLAAAAVAAVVIARARRTYHQNVIKAREFADEVLGPKIEGDARFVKVRVAPAGDGDMVKVTGVVRHHGDLAALRKILEDSEPPVQVKWLVSPLPEEFEDEDGETAGGSEASSPAELIRTILACSKAKKYDALEKRICAVPLGPLGVLTRDVAIQKIMDQDKSDTGDFSYSDEAAELLLKEHIGKFSAEIPDGWMGNMKHEDFSIPELRKLALEGKDNFRVLTHGKVFVLVARVSGEYKLVFSVGLNHLLKK